jgi:hypothetical protein
MHQILRKHAHFLSLKTYVEQISMNIVLPVVTVRLAVVVAAVDL